MRKSSLIFFFCVVTYLVANHLFAGSIASDRSILEGLNFDQGSSVLKKAVVASLEPLLEEMKSDPSLRVTIESHVDATGEPDRDLQLSRDRAQTISNWLVAQGLDTGRISPMGYGSSRPLVAKDAGTVKNTRIEIVKTREGFPVAEFPTTQHQFEPVVDGMDVHHNYVVRNTGSAELVIKEVKTG